IVDSCPGIGSGEKLGLVQFNGPSAELHPVCKARWGLQRVVAFARQEITQTELCWINVHRASDSVPLAIVCTDGVSQQNLIIFSFTKIPYEVLHYFHGSWSFVSGQQCKGFRISDKGFSATLAPRPRAKHRGRTNVMITGGLYGRRNPTMES